MRILNGIKKYIADSDYRWQINDLYGLYKNMPDDKYLCRKFKIKMGYELNLDNPQTFNEKIQWLKLYDRKDIYTTMVDKYAVKKYVSDIIGEEYIIPLIGVWDRVEDIPFDSLPEQFVLKCTHDSHGVVICRDKKTLDIQAVKAKLKKALKTNYYYRFREWPYKNVKPRILAEQYMEGTESGSHNHILNDYKVYTFNGEAKMCVINQDRGIHTTAAYFDRDFHQIDMRWGFDPCPVTPSKPENYLKMFALAEKIAAGQTQLRVDFYEVDGKLYFGEITFFDGSGFDKIEPVEMDYKLGSWIHLPNKEGEK